jgi:hypothetical protein
MLKQQEKTQLMYTILQAEFKLPLW